MGILKYDKSNMSEYDGVLPHHFGPSSWITSIRVLCHLRKQLDSPAIDIWSMRVCQTKLLVARNSKKVSLVQRARHFQTWMSSVSKLQLSPTMLVLVGCENSCTGLHCWSSFQWKSNWGHESSCWMCLVRFDLWCNSSYLNMWLFWGGAG